MARQLQHRRGTTANHSTFTGATAEITVDTDKKTAVVHDGVTAGGFPLASTSYANTFNAAQRGTIVTLTDGATITPDFALANIFTVTLAGNRILANPTNLVAGQTGSIFVVQDATGSRTLSYGSSFKFAGGTAPTLSTTANAVDRIDYIVRSSTNIQAVFTANYN